MTIARKPWPVDSIDKFQISRLIHVAQAVDLEWKPPAGFEYELLIPSLQHDFRNPVPTMRRHVGDLWQTLPPAAQLGYFCVTIGSGIHYATEAAHAAQGKLQQATPEQKQRLRALAETLNNIDIELSDIVRASVAA